MQSGGKTIDAGVLGGLVIGGGIADFQNLIDEADGSSPMQEGIQVDNCAEEPADAFVMADADSLAIPPPPRVPKDASILTRPSEPVLAEAPPAPLLDVRVRTLADTPHLIEVVRGNRRPPSVVTIRRPDEGAEGEAELKAEAEASPGAEKTEECLPLSDDRAWEALLEALGAGPA